MAQPAAENLSTESIFSLADMNFLLVNKLVVLLGVLIFFVAVMILRRSKGQNVPAAVGSALMLSLLGLLLLYFEASLSDYPNYRAVLAKVQGVIVLICLARLVIYLVVDVMISLRMQGEVPMLIRDVIRLVVYLAAAIISLRLVFQVDLAAVVTTTTVLTAAVAFAMQSTLANILCGFNIQTDPKLARGNWIVLPDKNLSGQIDNVGFRYTTLRTPTNSQVLVPNSMVVQNVIITHGNSTGPSAERAALTLTVGLPYEMPPEEARGLLQTVLAEDTLVLDQPQPGVRLQSFNDSSIAYLLKFWIADPQQTALVLDTLQTKIWYAINRAGWSFPFPHRQVVSVPPKTSFPPLRAVVLDGLRQSHLFEVLQDSELEFLAERARLQVFAPGETAVRQGESGTSLYFVLQGEMSVELDGRQVTQLEKGRMFGEMSLLTGAVRSATVRAITEARLAELQKEDLASLFEQNERLLEKLSQALERHQAGIRDHQILQVVPSGQVEPAAGDYLRRVRAFFFGGA